MNCYWAKVKTVFVKQRVPQPCGTSGAPGQCDKGVNDDVIWKYWTHGWCMPNVNTVPCIGQKLHTRLKFADRCTYQQTSRKRKSQTNRQANKPLTLSLGAKWAWNVFFIVFIYLSITSAFFHRLYFRVTSALDPTVFSVTPVLAFILFCK